MKPYLNYVNAPELQLGIQMSTVSSKPHKLTRGIKISPSSVPVKKPKGSYTKIHLPKITQEAGYTRNPRASFSYFPDKTDFLNRDAEEEIILLVRKHPITNVKWILMAFLMLVAPMFLTVFPPFGCHKSMIPNDAPFFLFLHQTWTSRSH